MLTLTRRNAVLTALGLGASMAADSLTSLFTAKPDGPAPNIRYRQGIIQNWNPVTLENTVMVGRTAMTNLPVLGVAEAASYRPGIVVGVAVIESTWAIVGRFVIPGSTDAEDAITQIGQRTYTATVLTQQSTAATSFTDLATVGPRVSDVRIPASGKARVSITVQFAATSVVLTAGSVGVEVSGAASIAPNSQQSLAFIADNGGINVTRVVLFEGLPVGGLCTFTLKYLTGGASVDFSNRDIIVETL